MKYVQLTQVKTRYTLFYDTELVRVVKEDLLSIPVDSIVHGRVLRTDPKMHAAFVDIGEGKDAYVNMPAGGLKSGEDLFFNVRKMPDEEKGTVLDFDLKLSGELAILLPLSRGIKNIKAMKRHQVDMRALESSIGMGFILRSKASEATVEAVREDVIALVEAYQKLSLLRSTLPVPKVIYRANLPSQKEIERREASPGTAEELLPLFERRRAQLLDGHLETDHGQMIIDTRPHFAFVDVNSGKFSLYDERRKNRYAINEQMIDHVLSIVQLRNLEGMILVDLLKMDGEDQKRLIHRKNDDFHRADVTVHGFSHLGLLEMTRKKVGGCAITRQDVDRMHRLLSEGRHGGEISIKS